ncbi:MAG: stage II sporulation protein P [Clostridia bacterium]|nr:stage II sporulation protein P [Clostridia bacterium]
MFNVTVLKMKDIMKYLVGIIITIGVVVYTARYFYSKKNNLKEAENKMQVKLEIFSFGSLTGCLDKTVPTMSYMNEEYNKIEKENEEKKEINYLEEILKTEISTIKGIEKIEKESQEENIKEAVSENEEKNLENKSEDIILANTEEIKTEVVTQNPITESYNVQYGNVKIKNQTTYTLTEEILKPDIKIDNKNILIFHTHSCESYTSSDKYTYTSTGNYRTTDLNYTVTRVGTELENYLKQYNLNVIHDTSYHDYPSYTGSYTRSLQTVENMLKTSPSDIIIDLHRDAIGSRSDYAPTVKIGEDYAAQIMFVIGTNEGGLLHPNWNQNLKFAIKIQQKAEEMYPGLFKPIMVTKSRYNQHTGKYANIIEVGATGNTLEQCITSMKYLSSVMNEVISE